MRAVTLLALLLWLSLLPGVASAGPLSLYGPFDQKHSGVRGNPPTRVTSSEVFSGCGKGRLRDPATYQCKGPADLR